MPSASLALQPSAAPLPAATSLQALAEQVRLGYPRGIHRWLDHVDANEPGCAAFTQRLRVLAGQFRLDAMAGVLADALREREAIDG